MFPAAFLAPFLLSRGLRLGAHLTLLHLGRLADLRDLLHFPGTAFLETLHGWAGPVLGPLHFLSFALTRGVVRPVRPLSLDGHPVRRILVQAEAAGNSLVAIPAVFRPLLLGLRRTAGLPAFELRALRLFRSLGRPRRFLDSSRSVLALTA